jgi:glyoxylase-like metal-dependent hydrolase (beta-lactamase superfamily II)
VRLSSRLLRMLQRKELPLRLRTITLQACWLLLPIWQFGQNTVPEWCRQLPRPDYKSLERVKVSDPWFEVYKPAPQVFAIYEPHQWEETIGYLIVGDKRAIEFDTGMGISDIKKVIGELTPLPVTVLNSHTHGDHVGGNWEFDDVEGMDTRYTRRHAEGSREVQAEIAPGKVCGTLPAGFDAKAYETRPWKIAAYIHDGSRFDLGGRAVEVLATPGHTPDSISLIDRKNGLLFTGDTFYPGTIYLFGAGTDLAAYSASVHALAALAPRLKLVMGAHNVPVASPEVLPKLAAAFDKARAAKAAVLDESSGPAVVKMDGFAFLMSVRKAE